MMRLHVPVLILGMLVPAPATAFDCDFYQACCEELAEAYREAGATPAEMRNFTTTCTLHHVFDNMPGAQHLFCLDAWEAMSRTAYQHYLDGRIGFYPPDCMADPLYDPDEILEPDPSVPAPIPETDLEERD